MKNLIREVGEAVLEFKNLLIAIAIVAILAATVMESAAQPQTYLPYQGDLLVNSGPILLPTNGTTNLTGQKVIKLPPRTSIAFFPYLSGAGGASTSNVIFQLAVGPGYQTNRGAYGTNLTVSAGTTLMTTTSLTGLQITTTLQGTTNVLDFKTINWTNWDGAIALELLSIQNQSTNAVAPTVSNLWYSFQGPQQ